MTGTGASAARWYWEWAKAVASADPAPADSVPVGFTDFASEIWGAPRSWAELAYPTLSYYNKADRGGHFPAWEQPELLSTEIRAAFASLR